MSPSDRRWIVRIKDPRFFRFYGRQCFLVVGSETRDEVRQTLHHAHYPQTWWGHGLTIEPFEPEGRHEQVTIIDTLSGEARRPQAETGWPDA